MFKDLIEQLPKFVRAERRAIIGVFLSACFGALIGGWILGDPIRQGLITGISFLLGVLVFRAS